MTNSKTHSMISIIKKAASGFALAGALFMSTPAKAQIVIQFPSPEIVATTPPVYYEGRAHYWYGGHWYYRDGRSWRYYNDEPVYLHDYRGQHGYDHYYYEGHREGPHGYWNHGGGWDYRGGGWDRRGGDHHDHDDHEGDHGEHGDDHGEHGGDHGEHGGDHGEHRGHDKHR